jgi:glycosyltransferase involved in cell wall biosynthesis
MVPRLPARADCVIAHRSDLITAGALIAARQRARFIFHAHNAPPEGLRWRDLLREPGTRAIRKVIVPSEFMARSWRAVVRSAVPIDVVENPVACDFFELPSAAARAAAKGNFRVGADTLVLGYFGRLEEEKGVHVLADAAARIAADRPVHVLLQGAANLQVPAPIAQRYRERCDAAFATAGRTWLEPSPDVRPLLFASDVVAVPSVWAEPSGLTVSEALATGTPVVASRIGGIPAQMPDSPLAALFEPGRADALADAIRCVATIHPTDDRRRFLRAHVVARRSRQVAADRYLTAVGAQLVAAPEPQPAVVAERVNANGSRCG